MTISLNVKNSKLNEVYSFNIQGVRYYFHCYYNKRADGWQIVVYDSNNSPLTTTDPEILIDLGKMMPNAALLWGYVSDNGIFQGELVCVDTIGLGVDPVTKDNFGDGKQYQLVFFTQEEIEEFQLSEWTTYGIV